VKKGFGPFAFRKLRAWDARRRECSSVHVNAGTVDGSRKRAAFSRTRAALVELSPSLAGLACPDLSFSLSSLPPSPSQAPSWDLHFTFGTVRPAGAQLAQEGGVGILAAVRQRYTTSAVMALGVSWRCASSGAGLWERAVLWTRACAVAHAGAGRMHAGSGFSGFWDGHRDEPGWLRLSEDCYASARVVSNNDAMCSHSQCCCVREPWCERQPR
jgi:hypothetical protein